MHRRKLQKRIPLIFYFREMIKRLLLKKVIGAWLFDARYICCWVYYCSCLFVFVYMRESTSLNMFISSTGMSRSGRRQYATGEKTTEAQHIWVERGLQGCQETSLGRFFSLILETYI